MTVRLSSGNQDGAIFGTRTGATNGLDQNIDVLNPPPPPPPNNFDTYFEITHPFFPQLSEDYRSDQEDTLVWKLVIMATAGRSGTIRWNASAFPVGDPARAVLQIKQGETILANMLSQDSLNFTGDQILPVLCFSTGKTAVAASPVNTVPESFSVRSYPNPFATSTTFEISLSRALPVTVRVFNVLGQEIRSFNLRPIAPGQLKIEWNGRDARGNEVPNGIYLLRLAAPGAVVTRKLHRVR
jgi:hypothetical protein